MSSLPTTTLRRRSREAYTPPPRTLAQTAARNLQLNVLGLIGIAVGLVVLLSNLPAHVGHGSSKQPAELHHVKRALDPMAAQRAKSALVGAFVADAATSGVHWVYHQGTLLSAVRRDPPADGPKPTMAELKQLVADQAAAWAADAAALPPLDLAALEPEFLEPSPNPFYKPAHAGAPSPYGEEAAHLLRSLVKERALVRDRYAADSAAALEAALRDSPYVNHLGKEFVAAWQAGKRGAAAAVTGNDQAHSLVRVPPIVARYFGEPLPELLARVEEAVRVQQDSAVAVAYGRAFAAILHDVVHGAPLLDAAGAAAGEGSALPADVRATIAEALAARGGDPRAIGSKFGLSCTLPGAFTVALAIAAANAGSYRDAVRANALAGGDNASRAAMIGALVAAAAPPGAPPGWKDLRGGAAAAAAVVQEAEAAADTLAAAAAAQ